MYYGDALYFDQRFVFKQRRDFDERHGGKILSKLLAVHFADRCEIIPIEIAALYEDQELDDIGHFTIGGIHHDFQIRERLPELQNHVAGMHDLALCVERNLTS